MKNAIAILVFVAACGEVPAEAPVDNSKHIINAGKFTEDQVRIILSDVYADYADMYPDAEEKLEAYGYEINLIDDEPEYNKLTEKCGRSVGCTHGNTVWVNTNGWGCVVKTALSHELQHLINNAEGRSTSSHPFPDFFDDEKETLAVLETTREWAIIDVSVKQICPKEEQNIINWYTHFCVK